jgi:gamma-glutamylcyclotransferase (GGCT)/AIG2-like uncharacterized protein YtfP
VKRRDEPVAHRENAVVSDRLFVYGTLAPGRPNEHVLRPVPGTWEPAVVRGRLHEHGWGAALGFPALVLDGDGAEVEGLLFSSQALSDHWERLDEFEGPGYERVLTQARRPGGELMDAYVYVVR